MPKTRLLSPAERVARSAALGIVAGAAGCAESRPAPLVEIPTLETTQAPASTGDPLPTTPRRATGVAEREQTESCCRGLNECKGKGNCKNAGANDCKGKNDCKAKGGCKPAHCDAASPTDPALGANCCKGKNDCKGLGGCKTAQNACKGKNACKGTGGCRSGTCH